jgi:hypothetical protein
LKWLTKHDPKQFNWTEKGTLLVTLPYAPFADQPSEIPHRQVKELIQAIKNWVR